MQKPGSDLARQAAPFVWSDSDISLTKSVLQVDVSRLYYKPLVIQEGSNSLGKLWRSNP